MVVNYSTGNLPATWEDFFSENKQFPNITISYWEEGKDNPFVNCFKEMSNDGFIDIFTKETIITKEIAANLIKEAIEEFFQIIVEVEIKTNPLIQAI